MNTQCRRTTNWAIARISIVSPCLKVCPYRVSGHARCVARYRFFDFRTGFSIDISPHVTGFTRHVLSRRNQLGFKKILCLQMRLRAHEHCCPLNFGKNADRMSTYVPLLICRTIARRGVPFLVRAARHKYYFGTSCEVLDCFLR